MKTRAKRPKGVAKRTRRQYKGGAYTTCPICKVPYTVYDKNIKPLNPNMRKCGCPIFGDNSYVYFEDHILTHPICRYCGVQQLNSSALAEHLEQNHNAEYVVARREKYGLTNNSLITMLELGSYNNEFPDINSFYKAINDAITKSAAAATKKAAADAKKAAADAKKAIAAENAEKKKAAAAEANAKKKEEEAAAAAAAANKAALEAEEAKIKKAQKEAAAAEAAKRKADEEEAAAAKKKAEATAAASAKKAAKKAEKMAKKEAEETESMFLEDKNVMPPLPPPPLYVPLPPVTLPPFIYNITSIPRLFPKMCFKLNAFNEYADAYKNINYCVLFNVGILNWFLKMQNIDLQLILKGGKAAQILNKNICSNDIDIMLVTQTPTNRDFLMNIAMQFANHIRAMYNRHRVKLDKTLAIGISILDPSSPEATNPNIVKVSYEYAGSLVTGYSNGVPLYKNEFIPVCDIDFSQQKGPFFDDIVMLHREIDGYQLLFYHQSLESFDAEKRHYYDVYNQHIQNVDGHTCDCSIKHPADSACNKICSYRGAMLRKFKNYVTDGSDFSSATASAATALMPPPPPRK